MELTEVQITAIVLVALGSLVGVALFGRAIGHLVRVFRLGRPDPTRGGRRWARAYSTLVETIGHPRMLTNPLVGLMHWFVFIGFGALIFTLLTAYGQLFDPRFALPVIGHWAPFEWLTEVIAWLTGIGIAVLIVIRQRQHPRRYPESQGRRSRFFGSSFWQAYYVEATIAAVVVCILLLRGLEYALAAADGGAPSAAHFPTTAWLGRLLDDASAGALETGIVLVATIKIIVSMAWFVVIGLVPTMGVAWHRFLVFPNTWLRRYPGTTETASTREHLKPSLGALQPIRVGGAPVDFEQAEDLPEDAALGVGKIEDFTWKDLLDVTTCTECGRCQSQCPAWATDKPLSPKLLVLNLRDHAHAKAPWLLADEQGRAEITAGAADDPRLADVLAQVERPLVGPVDLVNPQAGGVIDPDVIWSCTSCGACVQECPVDIEHLDHIVDLRRNQVLMEAEFPPELNALFRNLERSENPWGAPQRQRLDWAKDLPFEVPVVGGPGPQDPADLTEVEYLYWVGCAGAFDDRQKRTTRAVAELLTIAGVRFAVLGPGEVCTGDPARRAGNEVVFQLLAAANVATLNEAGAKKVVTACAHCFNTILNEYPQLGGHYEVVHHTQLLNRLVRERRLLPMAPPSGDGAPLPGAPTSAAASPAAGGGQAPKAGNTTVTYHDPCYIGRHNGVYSPPRELIAALPGVELAEMPRNSERSFCCGAGGARMWMEETIGTRINANRTAEALATGAQTVAVACPFCRVMLGDGLAAAQAGGEAGSGAEQAEVADVAQLLLAAVRRGQDSG